METAPLKVRIRAYEPRDLAEAHEIHQCPGVQRFTLHLPSGSAEALGRRYAAEGADAHRLVAVAGERVIGMVGLRLGTRPRRRHGADLGIAVHDDFQGRGVGRALVAAACDLADRFLGLVRVQLEVHVDNAGAIALYEKMGFLTEGRLRAQVLRDGVYIDTFVMARVRPPPRLD